MFPPAIPGCSTHVPYLHPHPSPVHKAPDTTDGSRTGVYACTIFRLTLPPELTENRFIPRARHADSVSPGSLQLPPPLPNTDSLDDIPACPGHPSVQPKARPF